MRRRVIVIVGAATLAAIAVGPPGRPLRPSPGTVAGDAAGSLRMHEFDARREAYTGPVGTYQLDDPAHAIGDAIAVDDRRFLVIERDSGQGDAAQVKKIYLATKSRGRLARRSSPICSTSRTRSGSAVSAPRSDDNFPGSAGRTPNTPDDNEFITIRLARELDVDKRFL